MRGSMKEHTHINICLYQNGIGQIRPKYRRTDVRREGEGFILCLSFSSHSVSWSLWTCIYVSLLTLSNTSFLWRFGIEDIWPQKILKSWEQADELLSFSLAVKGRRVGGSVWERQSTGVGRRVRQRLKISLCVGYPCVYTVFARQSLIRANLHSFFSNCKHTRPNHIHKQKQTHLNTLIKIPHPCMWVPITLTFLWLLPMCLLHRAFHSALWN